MGQKRKQLFQILEDHPQAFRCQDFQDPLAEQFQIPVKTAADGGIENDLFMFSKLLQQSGFADPPAAVENGHLETRLAVESFQCLQLLFSANERVHGNSLLFTELYFSEL